MAHVWITDGSLIPFAGVHHLAAVHPGLFGLRASYKGLIDPSVPIGSATICAERVDDVLCVEAEWCVQFPEGIERYLVEPESFSLSTPVVMQGLIEGKWLNRLLGTDAWAPATLGNNLLAVGPGIRTSIGAIEQGTRGKIEVSYKYHTEGEELTQVHSATLVDLAGQNILGLARDVLRFCRDNEHSIDAIDLGAIGEAAALVNERRRIRAAMGFGLGPIPNPVYFVMPSRRFDLIEKVVRAILAEGLTVPPDSPVSIRTYDHDGVVVGQGTLIWK